MRCSINNGHPLRRICLAFVLFAYNTSLPAWSAYVRGTGYAFRWRYGRRPDGSESELLLEGNRAVQLAGPLTFLYTLNIYLQELRYHEKDRLHLEERLKRVHRRGKLVLHLIGIDSRLEPWMAWLGVLRGREETTASLWNLTRTTGLPGLLDFQNVSLELVFNVHGSDGQETGHCRTTFYEEHGEDLAGGAYQSDRVVCVEGLYHEAKDALARYPCHEETIGELAFCEIGSDQQQCDTGEQCRTPPNNDLSPNGVPDFAMMINAGLGSHESGEDTFRPTLLHLASTAIPTIVTNYAGSEGDWALTRDADSSATPIIAEHLAPAFFAEPVQGQEAYRHIWDDADAVYWKSPFCDAYVLRLRDISYKEDLLVDPGFGRRRRRARLPWKTKSKTYCAYSSGDVKTLRGHGIAPKFLGNLPFVWVDNVLEDGISGVANSNFVVL